MLDKRTGAVLFKINALCKENGYQIVETGELCDPKERESLDKTLAYLKEHGYIDVRYSDGGVYCLTPLPEGRLYFEETLRERTEEVRRTRSALLLGAIGALVGSFFGALLALLLFGAAGRL